MMRTVSSHERLKKGFIPWDERPESVKNMGISSWMQFYHKPYECDIGEAKQKARERMWRYTE